MRKFYYLLAAISVALFIYSVIHLGQQFSATTFPSAWDVKGFEINNPSNEYKQLVEKFRQKITLYEGQADKDQKRYFWMTFIVTVLTAGATLISSIQAGRKDPDNLNRAQTFAVVIAILAFCSTLANFASSHFNERKTEETKRAVALINMRNQFYTDYDKAPIETKPNVITSYDRLLD